MDSLGAYVLPFPERRSQRAECPRPGVLSNAINFSSCSDAALLNQCKGQICLENSVSNRGELSKKEGETPVQMQQIRLLLVAQRLLPACSRRLPGFPGWEDPLEWHPLSSLL